MVCGVSNSPDYQRGYFQIVTAMTAWCVSAMKMDLGLKKHVLNVDIGLTKNVTMFT